MKVQEQVFGRRSAVSPLQGDTRGCLEQAFSHCCSGLLWIYSQIKNQGKIMYTQAQFWYANLSAWDSIFYARNSPMCKMQIAQFACHIYHVVFSAEAPKSCFCRVKPCCSFCQKKLNMRMSPGIPSFLLLSNVRDFLIWWSTQVALRGGVCSQRWNFLLFLHAVFERLFWRYVMFGRL